MMNWLPPQNSICCGRHEEYGNSKAWDKILVRVYAKSICSGFGVEIPVLSAAYWANAKSIKSAPQYII